MATRSFQAAPRSRADVAIEVNRSFRELGYRSHQVIAFIRETVETRGHAPSYGDISNHLGISTKGEVCRIVQGLEQRGLVYRAGTGRTRRINLRA